MHATQQDVMTLLRRQGLQGQEAARALLLCGAPLDQDTAVVCRELRKSSPTLPTVKRQGEGREQNEPTTLQVIHFGDREPVERGDGPAVQPEGADTQHAPPASNSLSADLHASPDVEGGDAGGSSSATRVTIDLTAGDDDPAPARQPAPEQEAGSSRDDPIYVGMVEAIAPGHPAPDGVFHAAARGEVQTPQLAGADARIELISERTCAFVRVVIHDGERAVYASTSKQAGMGGLNGELATVAGKATPDLFWGIYAAQQAVRTRVGAVWEYPELEMRRGKLRLVGATTVTTKKGKNTHTAWYEMRTRRPLGEIAAVLQTCHANRNQTDVEQIYFPSLAILEPAEVCPAASAAAGAAVAEAAAIVSIVKGDSSSFAPVQLARLEVPNVIRAEDAERRDESFDAGVETGFDTMAFYELSGMVAGFSHAHAQILHQLGAEAASEVAAHRSTRAGIGKAILQDVTTQLEWGDDLRDGGDDDDDAGGSPVDGDEQEGSDDNERGREAHYSPPALQPRTDQPMAFLKRLVPAGLPRDIVEQMRTYQAADPYCIRMKNEVRLATEWATRRQVRAETAVRDGKVTLRLSPVAAVDAKRAAKLEAVLAEFVVG